MWLHIVEAYDNASAVEQEGGVEVPLKIAAGCIDDIRMLSTYLPEDLPVAQEVAHIAPPIIDDLGVIVDAVLAGVLLELFEGELVVGVVGVVDGKPDDAEVLGEMAQDSAVRIEEIIGVAVD